MQLICSEVLEKLDTQLDRIQHCLDRLDDASLWSRLSPATNSIGNLCLHLAGNENHYLGHIVGGLSYTRDRPKEFTTTGGVGGLQLRNLLLQARERSREVLERLSAEDLERLTEADYPTHPTVFRLLMHVVSHYAYHTGQIVLLTRTFQRGDKAILQWRH